MFVAPAPEDFVDRYVEFIDYPYDLIDVWLQQSILEVDGSWIASNRLEAVYALTAHSLVSTSGTDTSSGSDSSDDEFVDDGEDGGETIAESLGPLSVKQSQGQIIQETVGPLTVRYAPPP